MYESRTTRPLTRQEFHKRVKRHAVGALGMAVTVLGIGVLGYHYLVGLEWIDSLLDASMILGGMGPVNPIHSPEGKVFASLYALTSGLFFIAVAGVLVAPFAHRMMHVLHWDEGSQEGND